LKTSHLVANKGEIMAKRGDHEGTIRKLKNGKGFKGAVRLGVDADGKPIRKWVQRTRRDEVQAELKRLTRKFEQKQPINAASLTVGRFTTEWLEDWVKPNRSYSTYHSYEKMVRLYIVPLLGDVPLDDLTGQEVQKFLNKLGNMTAEVRFAKQRSNLGRKMLHVEYLSPASIQNTHAILKSALSRAVKWGKLAINPAKNAESPKQQKYEAHPLTLKQAAALTKAVDGDRYEFAFSCAAIGLRFGEILGLSRTDFVWSDNTFSAGVLNVTRQLQRVKGKGLVLVNLKSKKSRRQIKLPKFFIESYLRRVMIQEQDRIDAGEEWKETGLVFTDCFGGFVQHRAIRTIFKAALKKAGLPDIRFHDLRHTAATLLLAKGVPMKMVSEILGHSTPQITMEIYAHVTEEMRDQSTDAFDQIHGGDAIGTPASDKIQ
jgi:integrase